MACLHSSVFIRLDRNFTLFIGCIPYFTAFRRKTQLRNANGTDPLHNKLSQRVEWKVYSGSKNNEKISYCSTFII